MNNYKIKITQRAYFSILECVKFVKNVSNEAADDLYDEIMSAIDSLKSFPNKFPEVEGLLVRNKKIRKISLHKGRYAVLYKLEEDIIEIYDIIDLRKNNLLNKIL